MTESDQKGYEERLQRRLQILKKQFEAGKITLAPDSQVIESLKAVRFAPDGTVDLASVDGLVRSLALAVEIVHDREELKKSISLAEIQNTYFSFVERNFGQFYRIMLDRGLTPHDAGIALSRKESTIAKLTKNLAGFLATIEEFWTHVGDAAHIHVEDMHEALKGVLEAICSRPTKKTSPRSVDYIPTRSSYRTLLCAPNTCSRDGPRSKRRTI
jgi:hypothetical protein